MIGEPLEALAGDEEASDAASDGASAAAEETAASDPAPPVADEPEVAEESAAPADGTKSPATSDGSDSSDNAPPVVEEFVNDLEVVVGADSATVYFPEFGAEDSYAIQMLNADGTWKTLKTGVEDADARTREGVSEAAADADFESTLENLTPGKTYTIRVASADARSDIVAATEDADVIAGPGRGAMVRSIPTDVVVAQVTVTQPESFTIAPYVRSTGNPDLIEKCGLDVALILDVSGSIGSGANLTLLKDAAKAFITGIEGTGSKASITTFSTAGQVLRTAQVMDATNAADFRSAINGLSSNGWTNWYDAIVDARSTFPGFSQKPGTTGNPGPFNRPDLVVMITDGNPNRILTTDGDRQQFANGAADAVNPAIRGLVPLTAPDQGTNLIKNQGAHMLAIGVGDALDGDSEQNALKAISDRTPFDGSNLRTADYVISSFTALPGTITSLVGSFCKGFTKESLTASPVTVGSGPAFIDYKVTTKNNYPANGPTLTSTLEDVLPDGVSYVANSAKVSLDGATAVAAEPAGANDTAPQTLTWSGSDTVLAPGEERVFTYRVEVITTADEVPLENVATWEEIERRVEVTTDVLPAIEVTKVANPTSVPEPGGDVTYTFTVKNTSPAKEPVTITSLSDDKFGTLAGDADCQIDTVLAWDASCTFQVTKALVGQPGDSHKNVFTAKAEDNEENEASDTADATVTFTDVLPAIEVTKVANPTSVPEPGGDVTYTFTVKNTSPAKEPVTITSLSDDKFGTLAGDADCQIDTVLAWDASCTFQVTKALVGQPGDSHKNVFTAKAEDNEENEASDTADATVTFTDVLPAIEVTKVANPTSVPEPGGDVTYTFTVKNTSPAKEPVTITSLSDDKFGTLAGDADCQIDTVLAWLVPRARSR